jgi:hypothetical protein
MAREDVQGPGLEEPRGPTLAWRVAHTRSARLIQGRTTYGTPRQRYSKARPAARFKPPTTPSRVHIALMRRYFCRLHALVT